MQRGAFKTKNFIVSPLSDQLEYAYDHGEQGFKHYQHYCGQKKRKEDARAEAHRTERYRPEASVFSLHMTTPYDNI